MRDVPANLANGYYVIKAAFAGNANFNSQYAATSTGTNLFVVPEYIFGALAALGACFVGFVAFKKRSNIPHLRF
jgi:hypothetical protein